MDLAQALGEIKGHVLRAAASATEHVSTTVEIDRQGDGVLLVRSAALTTDALEVQARRLTEWCASHDRAPRVLIASAGVSGIARLDDRPDLLAALGHAVSGCSWVAAANACCVSRDSTVLLDFLRLLDSTQTQLFLYGLGNLPLAGEQLALFMLGRGEQRRRDFSAQLRLHAARHVQTNEAG
jgi:hypothetical protein